MGKAVAGAALALLIVGLLSSAFNVQPVMASTVVYIRADGSIDPPTSPIVSVDNITYTVTDNLYGSITVERDDIVVDGAGFLLQGTGSEEGIYLSSRNNVTIRNVDIRGFQYGIFLWHCSHITMLDNNATANNADGISMWGSSSNTLMRNRAIANNVHGIYISESSNNNLVDNTAMANKLYGVTVASSSGNTLTGNNITANENDGITISASACNILTGNVMQSNGYNFGVYGYSLNDFIQSIDTSNLINGVPIYYLINQTNLVVNPESYQTGYLGLVNCVNTTVERLDLANNINGLLLANTNDSRIAMSTFSDNRYGIYLWGSSDNELISNNVTSNLWSGIHLSVSSGNYIFHNNLVNNSYSVYTDYSTNFWNYDYPSGGNYWEDYNGTDDYRGFNQDILGSDGLGDVQYLIDVNNRDRYPLMHPWSSVPVRNIRADADYGRIQEAINANETIEGDTLFVRAGTYFENIIVNKTLSIVGENRETTILDGSAADSVVKISAPNTTILRLTIRNAKIDQDYSGIYVYNSSSNNAFRENKVTGCYVGIFLKQSSGNNMLTDNFLTNNSYGITLSETHGDFITWNSIRANDEGIWIAGSTDASILGNDIAENHYGIRIDSDNSSVYHNDFVNNTLTVSVSSSGNVWDNGYPGGGNYWNDYDGPDLFSGPYQTENGADGIGDVPYAVDAYNTDNYPLTNPYERPDLAVLNITTLRSIVGRGFTMLVNVTVGNLGNKAEFLNTTLCSNTTEISLPNAIILKKANSATFSFVWNTSEFQYGNYSLWAYVTPLQDEANTNNNIKAYGTVLVTILGDFDGDLKVKPQDLNALLVAYGSPTNPEAPYNLNCDLDGDGTIGPIDLNTLLVHYGQHYP